MEENLYKFVFIKTNQPNVVNLIEVVQDVTLQDTYQFYRSNAEIDYFEEYENSEPLLDTNVFEYNKNYLIQYIETGDFGYWNNGVANVFINSIDIENDIYHYFYMQFSL